MNHAQPAEQWVRNASDRHGGGSRLQQCRRGPRPTSKELPDVNVKDVRPSPKAVSFITCSGHIQTLPPFDGVIAISLVILLPSL